MTGYRCPSCLRTDVVMDPHGDCCTICEDERLARIERTNARLLAAVPA